MPISWLLVNTLWTLLKLGQLQRRLRSRKVMVIGCVDICGSASCRSTPLNNALGSIQTTMWSCWRLVDLRMTGECCWRKGGHMCSSKIWLFTILPKKKSEVVVWEFLHPAPISGFLIPSIIIPWVSQRGARLRKTSTVLSVTPTPSWWPRPWGRDERWGRVIWINCYLPTDI